MGSTGPRSAVSFDLISEPCIPVMTSDEGLQWRSLREVFAAADLDEIAVSHPSPGTEIACYELLLAICHAAGYTPALQVSGANGLTMPGHSMM